MVSVSIGTTVTQLVPANPERVALVVTNEDTADEVVRLDTDREGCSASALIIYNRESIKLTGAHAKQRWFIISDTAATACSYFEVF